MINTLVLSDLHLGDTEGLLYDNAHNIINLTIQKIGEIVKNTDDIPFLKRLVLAGDIPDLAQARTDDAYTHTRYFIRRIFNEIDCEEIVYIPGNHDHHFWVELIENIDAKDHGKAEGYYIQSKKTDRIIENDEIPKECKEKIIPDNFKNKVSISYPNYEFEVCNSHFFVTHGHFFSNYWHYFFPDLRKEEENFTLEKVEEETYKFMETVWWEMNSRPIEFLYDNLLRNFPLFPKVIIKSFKSSNRKYGTSFEEDSTLGNESTLKMIKWYLEKICNIRALSKKEKEFHLIYGHTHQGGRILEQDAKVRIKGHFISVWNLGGWIVPSQRYSPDAYIFYVKEDEAEKKAIPAMEKIVAKPENGEGDGCYERSLLFERLERIGQ